jgi:hypothetical protein
MASAGQGGSRQQAVVAPVVKALRELFGDKNQAAMSEFQAEFSECGNQLTYHDFFELLKRTVRVKGAEWAAAKPTLQEMLDPEERGYIFASTFGDFCRGSKIPWKSDYGRMQSKVL